MLGVGSQDLKAVCVWLNIHIISMETQSVLLKQCQRV